MNSVAIFTDAKSAIKIVIREELYSVFFLIVKWLFSSVRLSIRDALVDFNQTVFNHFVGTNNETKFFPRSLRFDRFHYFSRHSKLIKNRSRQSPRARRASTNSPFHSAATAKLDLAEISRV